MKRYLRKVYYFTMAILAELAIHDNEYPPNYTRLKALKRYYQIKVKTV